LIAELLDKGCIETASPSSADESRTASATDPVHPFDPPPASAPESTDNFLKQLPDASTRTAQEVEMARNLMMNAVNTVFQPNTRLTLLEAIFSCQTAQALRDMYAKWAETIHSSASGGQHMPEFMQKLSEVL
jgi:hypothetical protein